MNIGILAPDKVPHNTGIRNVVKGTMEQLLVLDKENNYFLFEDDYFNLGCRTVPMVRINDSQLTQKEYDFMSYCNRIDVIHSFWNTFEYMKSPAKKIITVHDLVPLIHPEWHTMHDYFDTAVRETVKKSDIVITISENSKKDIIECFGTPEEKIRVIYLGFQSSLSHTYTANVVEKYSLEEGYILSVCTLEPRKNLRGLIKGYVQYRNENPYSKIKLVLAGEFGWDEDFNKFLDEIGEYSDDIVMTGFVSDDELSALYDNAIGVVYVSYYEGFGLPILEALNFGKVVLSSNTTSMPEAGGDAVIYCNPYSIDSIAYGIHQLIDNDELRCNLVLKAKSQVEKFSYKKTAMGILDIYRELG